MQKTEMRNPYTTHIDKMSTKEMLEAIQRENLNATKAVGEALDAIGAAVDVISARIARGGRLIYIGAGTSGRLGVIDATECPPTYGVSPETVQGVMAGGDAAMFRSSENKEDDPEEGVRTLDALGLGEKDTLVGISANGNAAYVVNALRYAKEVGAATVALACNEGCRIFEVADIAILTDTGAEVVTGSTRMKAGTAHKLVLNMLSTCAMIKNGHVYENFMINLRPTNLKLRARVISIVCNILACDEDRAVALLDAADWNIRAAVEEGKA